MTAKSPAELAPKLTALLERFRARDRAALARAISLVEDERAGFEDFLHAALARPPAARRVGITGPPGAGKSSLVAALAGAYLGRGDDVGVVAVDPTSPFSGGALLGDRIRMNDLATAPGVFIRSMATRGSLGGLAATTREVVDLMDAFGFARLLVETVGVGQTELEITGAADTVVVVLVPESGDAVQVMKAGLMEIADLFVVNKADRPGADRLRKDIEAALHLRAADPGGWIIPVVATVAHRGEGLDALAAGLDGHYQHLEASGQLHARRLARAERRVRDVVERAVMRRLWEGALGRRLQERLERVARGEETPYAVARALVAELEAR